MAGSARNRVLVLFDFGAQRRGYFLHLSLVFTPFIHERKDTRLPIIGLQTSCGYH